MITNYNFMRSNYAKVLPLVYDDALSYLESVAQLVKKINEVIDEVNNVTTQAVSEANAYTDQQIANTFAEVNQALAEANRTIATLQTNYTAFTSYVNSELADAGDDIVRLEQTIGTNIQAVNERTDLAIQQNNEYLLSNMSQYLAQIKVVNYFTGESISVQDMFDYLAQFHTNNAITVNEVVTRSKTYDELGNYNMTYTQLALNGGAIII